MAVDPILMEIMNAKFAAIAEEMVAIIHRTSRSTFVKEAMDFSVGIADNAGKIFAFPRAANTFAIDRPCGTVIRAIPDVEPGDVICTNDPYTSGGLVTHVPDLHLLRPYFHDGRVVAYGWCFAHLTDIGGAVPGSMAPRLHEIFQEGVRFPPMKLMKAGKINKTFESIFRANCRIPDTNMGDVHAMVGALAAGQRQVTEICERYGAQAFVDCQKALQDYAAEKARAVLKKIPNGVYDFWDYMDDDLVSKYPVRLRIKMAVQDGEIHLDLTSTDPQSPSSFNCPTQTELHHWLVLKLTIFMLSHDRTIPLNAGIYRSIRATNPPGTIMNAEFPDAVAFRTLAATRLNDCVTGALLKASDDLMPAPATGCSSTLVLSEYAPGSNQPTVKVIQPMRGAMGAYKGRDGIDGRDVTINNMRNHPIESIENESGVLVLEYDIRPDSGGAGRWRGGNGQQITLEFTRDGSTFLMRGSDRFRFTAWGVSGGKPSASYELYFNKGKASQQRYTKIDRLSVQKGDQITVMMPGAAGFGDPLLRDPQLVAADVLRGFVSPEVAERDYGVIVSGSGLVDVAATDRIRKGKVRENRRADFDFGPEREAWETVFDDETMRRLTERLYRLPKQARPGARAKVFDAALPDLQRTGEGLISAAIGDADAARARLEAAMDEVLGPA